MNIKGEWTDKQYIPETPEEEEAWKTLEKKMEEIASKTAKDVAEYIDGQICNTRVSNLTPPR